MIQIVPIHQCYHLLHKNISPIVRCEVYMAVNIQVNFFWVVMPCSVVVGYQHLRGPCWLHLQGGKAWTSETLVTLPQHYTASQPIRSRLESVQLFNCQSLHVLTSTTQKGEYVACLTLFLV